MSCRNWKLVTHLQAIEGWLMAPISLLLIAALLILSGLYLVGTEGFKIDLFRHYQAR